jgi:hypothetical protein
MLAEIFAMLATCALKRIGICAGLAVAGQFQCMRICQPAIKLKANSLCKTKTVGILRPAFLG